MNEALIDTLLREASERLPGLLDDVSADCESADAAREQIVPLPPPVLYLFGKRINGPLEFPAVMIWTEDTVPELVGSSNQESGWDLDTSTLVFMFVFRADDEGIAERQLERYKSACMRFIQGQQSTPGSVSYALTPTRIGRDSHAAQVRIEAPGVRGFLIDIDAESHRSY